VVLPVTVLSAAIHAREGKGGKKKKKRGKEKKNRSVGRLRKSGALISATTRERGGKKGGKGSPRHGMVPSFHLTMPLNTKKKKKKKKNTAPSSRRHGGLGGGGGNIFILQPYYFVNPEEEKKRERKKVSRAGRVGNLPSL